MPEPSPPKVHAPHRVSGGGTPTSTGSDAQAVSASATSDPSTSSQGARITASVGGAQSPPAAGTPGGPTTSTPTTSTPTTSTPTAGAPGGGLARTGFDVGLVLMFALLAVLLGVLLVRLGSRRDRPTTTH